MDTILEFIEIVSVTEIVGGESSILEIVSGADSQSVVSEITEETVVAVDGTQINILELVEQGVPGVDGIDGIDGDLTYVHNQIAAAPVWNIIHALGKYPAVTVVDTANTQVEGNVEYIDANNVQLTFSAIFSGKAFCN